jgi:hypothetical protein
MYFVLAIDNKKQIVPMEARPFPFLESLGLRSRTLDFDPILFIDKE